MANEDQRGSPASRLSRNPDELSTAGQLALELMHEIRNPLEALSHLTYLAFLEADHPDRVRRYMGLAEEQVSTLAGIANQALGFARQKPQSVDLVDLAHAALRIHQRTIETRKIHLVKSFPDDLLAEVHGGQLLQVVSNLIVNALQALPDEGSLSLRLRKRNGAIHLIVADNGEGICEENLAHLFEPFFTTKDTGNGLGLSLSKRIVEAHGGRIKTRSSVRPGRSGTVFKISLPA